MLELAVLCGKVETFKGCQRTLEEATEAQSMISPASEEQGQLKLHRLTVGTSDTP